RSDRRRREVLRASHERPPQQRAGQGDRSRDHAGRTCGRGRSVRRRHRREAGGDARPPRPVLRSRWREAQVVTLEFLSVSAASDGALAKSSMERAQRDAGARFEERGGWLVPVSFPGEAERRAVAGIADLSHLSKFEIRPALDGLEEAGAVHYRISPRRSL